jgi:hypothetical protein
MVASTSRPPDRIAFVCSHVEKDDEDTENTGIIQMRKIMKAICKDCRPFTKVLSKYKTRESGNPRSVIQYPRKEECDLQQPAESAAEYWTRQFLQDSAAYHSEKNKLVCYLFILFVLVNCIFFF